MIAVTNVTRIKKERTEQQMGNKTNHAPFTRKENFWSRKRVENSVTLKEIANLLGKKETTVGAYFSGQLMPNDDTIHTLCDFFDVSFNDGQIEFQHAHREWKARHYAPAVYSAKKVTGKRVPSEKETTTSETPSNESVVKMKTLLKRLYGVLSCEDFVTVYNCLIHGRQSTFNLGEALYGKVDYDAYNEILAVFYLSDDKTVDAKQDKWSI